MQNTRLGIRKEWGDTNRYEIVMVENELFEIQLIIFENNDMVLHRALVQATPFDNSHGIHWNMKPIFILYLSRCYC